MSKSQTSVLDPRKVYKKEHTDSVQHLFGISWRASTYCEPLCIKKKAHSINLYIEINFNVFIYAKGIPNIQQHRGADVHRPYLRGATSTLF